ncbi:MAG: hypothetical protein ACK4L4_10625 [Gemmobacter sp.]
MIPPPLHVPALLLWLILPLVMRRPFRGADLPPTPAATAVLAILLVASMLAPGDPVSDRGHGDDSYVFGFAWALFPDHRHYLAGLGFVALGVAGAAMLAAGLADGQEKHRRRFLKAAIGTAAYAFHAGTGLIAVVTLDRATQAPRRYVADPQVLEWQNQAGIWASMMMTVAGLVVLTLLALALLRHVIRS